MDTNFERLKMLALRTLAGDELKNDINNATSFLRGIRCRFVYVVVCTAEINIVKNSWTVELALEHFMTRIVRPSHFDAYIVKCFALV